ncbi:MAG: sialidase family protein [Armatimonadota bacterium]
MNRYIAHMFIVIVLLSAFFTACQSVADVELSFDDTADFEEWLADRDSWSLEDGHLRQPRGGFRGTCAFYPHVYTDGAIQVRFFIHPAGSGVKAPGLIYRAVDENSFYYIHFDSQNSQVVWVRKEPDKSWTPDNTHRHRPIQIQQEQWHSARVEFEGDTHTVSLDDQELFTVRDDAYESGVVGLRAGQGDIAFDDFVVEGTDGGVDEGFSVTRPAWVEVCTDAGAGEYEAFPDICRTHDGELLCVFYAGYRHVSLPNEEHPKGGRVSMVRSADEGRTWSEPEIVVDTPLDDRDPSIAQLSNGDLLVSYFDRDPDRTPGARVFTVRSTDGGETWGEPQHVPLPIDKEVASTAVSEPVTELDDGTLLLPVYFRYTDSQDPGTPCAVLRSEDMGKTWPEVAVLEPNRGQNLHEPSIEPLPDGRIYMLIRPTMDWSVSEDGGVTWSEPQELGFTGDAPNLLLTDDDILLAGFRHRPTRSTSVAWSADYGQTWNGPKIIDRVIGGYPSFAQLHDGRVFMVYYTEGAGSDIRGVVLEVTEEGVTIAGQEKLTPQSTQ